MQIHKIFLENCTLMNTQKLILSLTYSYILYALNS
mgnify:FL=1